MCPAARGVEEDNPVRICIEIPIPIVVFIPSAQTTPVEVDATAVFCREHRGAVASVVREEAGRCNTGQHAEVARTAIHREGGISWHRAGATHRMLELRRQWRVR